MMSATELGLLVVLSILSVCVSALPDHGYSQLGYRNTQTEELSPKPVRDDGKHPRPVKMDGLGSLLLKNLRFRDLERSLDGERPLTYWDLENIREQIDSQADNASIGKRAGPEKRVSVSQLAELLHSLKSRGIDDDGVKLQSLRFGKK